MPYIAHHILEKCHHCHTCLKIVACPGAEYDICIGCGACVLACPHQAIELVAEERQEEVSIEVDGKSVQVTERLSVKEVLQQLGYNVANSLTEEGLFAPCQVGACSCCAVVIDGIVRPSCVTAAKDGMNIRTKEDRGRLPAQYCGWGRNTVAIEKNRWWLH